MARPKAKEPDRVLICGKPDFDRCDNKVTTARYTVVTFLPVVRSPFRRVSVSLVSCCCRSLLADVSDRDKKE
jgi:hypothetical protein